MLFIIATKRQGQEIKIFFSSDPNTIHLCEAVKNQTQQIWENFQVRYASKQYMLLKITRHFSQHSNSPHTETQDDEQNLSYSGTGGKTEVMIKRSQSNLSYETEVPTGICQFRAVVCRMETRQTEKGRETNPTYCFLITWQQEVRSRT